MNDIPFDGNAILHLISSSTTTPYIATGAIILGSIYYFFGSSTSSSRKHDEQLTTPTLNKVNLTKSESESSLTSSSSSSSSTTTNNNNITTTTTKSKSKSTKREITWKEFKQHDGKTTTPSKNEPWIVIHNQVYDISKFAPNHPGGDIIYQYAGRDATDEFDAFHMPRVKRSRLPAYHIGSIVDAPEPLPVTRDYRALRNKLWKEGWFEGDNMYYIYKDIIAFCILMLGVGCILLSNHYEGIYNHDDDGSSSSSSSIITKATIARVILGGSLIGLALQQVAFVAHDAGHRGITHPQPNGGINWLGWIHGSICFGVSIEMWVDEHSGHHAMTMRPHEDPQFKYLPVFLISSKELDRFHELSKLEQIIAKILVPFQHYTLIPISVIIGRFNLHAISLIYALKHQKYYDVAGLFLYLTWFGTIVSFLPLYERFPFVLISYIVAGILHVQLTISHLATESFTPEEDEKEQFFAFQCKTTRNIDSTKWEDWFHGGLQFQIEHHLFPQMPRHNLRKIKPYVMDLCEKHGVPYHTTGFCDAVGTCLKDFKRLSSFLGDLVHPHEIMPE